MTDYLLVHGAGQGAWSWGSVWGYLTAPEEHPPTLHKPRRANRVHLAFHVTSDEFDGVMGRLQADSVAFGPRAGTSDGQEGIFNGGRRLYFDAPGGLNVELMTVATAGLI